MPPEKMFQGQYVWETAIKFEKCLLLIVATFLPLIHPSILIVLPFAFTGLLKLLTTKSTSSYSISDAFDIVNHSSFFEFSSQTVLYLSVLRTSCCLALRNSPKLCPSLSSYLFHTVPLRDLRRSSLLQLLPIHSRLRYFFLSPQSFAFTLNMSFFRMSSIWHKTLEIHCLKRHHIFSFKPHSHMSIHTHSQLYVCCLS